MVSIHTNVQRRTRDLYRVLTNRERYIIVSLKPGDLLSFRENRCRATFELPIEHAFRIAVRAKVEADRRAKREGKAAR
jgi:hypothetical protein